MKGSPVQTTVSIYLPICSLTSFCFLFDMGVLNKMQPYGIVADTGLRVPISAVRQSHGQQRSRGEEHLYWIRKLKKSFLEEVMVELNIKKMSKS